MKESFLGFCLNQFKFINKDKLTYQGVHPCYVSKKIMHKRNMNSSSSTRYHLEVKTKTEEYVGVISVSGTEYDKARKDRVYGRYSIITDEKGNAKFSKKLTESYAMKDITSYARKITRQTVVAIILCGIPTLISLIYFISLFF